MRGAVNCRYTNPCNRGARCEAGLAGNRNLPSGSIPLETMKQASLG